MRIFPFGGTTGNLSKAIQEVQLEALNVNQVILTAAQVNGMFAAPVAVVPTPTLLPKLIILEEVVLELVYGTTQFAAGGAIQLSYGSANLTYPATPTIAATFLTSPTVSQVIKAAGVLASTALSNVTGLGLFISNATQAFTTGDSSLIVTTKYRTIVPA